MLHQSGVNATQTAQSPQAAKGPRGRAIREGRRPPRRSSRTPDPPAAKLDKICTDTDFADTIRRWRWALAAAVLAGCASSAPSTAPASDLPPGPPRPPRHGHARPRSPRARERRDAPAGLRALGRGLSRHRARRRHRRGDAARRVRRRAATCRASSNSIARSPSSRARSGTTSTARVTPQRVARGQDKLLQVRAEADAAAARYGVPPASWSRSGAWRATTAATTATSRPSTRWRPWASRAAARTWARGELLAALEDPAERRHRPRRT